VRIEPDSSYKTFVTISLRNALLIVLRYNILVETVKLFLFGSPRVERGGQLVDMDTRKALALFAYLAVAGSEQQRDSLVTLLYPEADPDGARAAFRRTLSTLHSALGDGILSIRRDAVGLAANADLWVDVLQFLEHLKRAEDLNSLDEAVRLYRGDFMAGFSLRDSPSFDDWQYQQAEAYRRMLDNALERLASGLESREDYSAAIQAAERRVGIDPLLEEAHRQLMGLYARSGQRGAAVHQYRECVRVLEQELGVAPLEATTRLYQEILSGKLERAAPALVEKHALAPAPQTVLQTVSQAVLQTVLQTVSQVPPLVGREPEMAALERILRSDKEPGWLIALVGEAGVGKTRLAEEFLARFRQAGRIVAQARCYEGQFGLAYTPFLEALQPLLEGEGAKNKIETLSASIRAEAARLFPGLNREPISVPLAEGLGAQTRFFESLRVLVNTLLGGGTGVLFLDDLHWADPGTLDLLSYLARRLKPAGCILLLAWREEPGQARERLDPLLVELQRGGSALHLPLGRMSPTEIRDLARSVNPALALGLAARLYQESEGLPFIALEYLHSAVSSAEEWKMPGGVRGLLHQRLQQPGEAARQLLSAAAVIGRSFDFNTLLNISGRSDWETVNGLEELVRLGLVREQEDGVYDFSHEKLRALVYEEMSLARRRLLHQRAAETLVSSATGAREVGSWAGLAANHFLLAGLPQHAADYFRQAGDHARWLHANQQALAAYQSALAAGHPDSAGLHEACGDLLVLSGEYGAAITSYQAAASFCEPGCLSNLMHKLGEVYHRRGDWDVAESHYRAALEAAGEDGDPIWQSHLFADWGLTAYRAGDPVQAQELAQRALQLAQQAGDSNALAQASNMMGILARARGELDQARAFFEQSLNAADHLQNLALRCASLHNLARLEQERGNAGEAVPLAHRALEYCTLLGDRHHQAALLNTLADLQHMLGNREESMNYLKQAVALFAEIGDDVGRDQPEIWKLTEW
jgi:DNA-binding SARP family transcriptional activator